MIPDQKLTDNFSLYELTVTSHEDLQAKNRDVDADQIGKLREVAELLEKVRALLGVPLKVNSAYRCQDVNRAAGSMSRSQHMLCEAADFIPIGLEIGEAFRQIRKEVQENRLPIGQLIFETAERSYGVTSWIHVSLGKPWRDSTRCQQVLRMENNVYTIV